MPVIPYLPRMKGNYPSPKARGVWDNNITLNRLAQNLPDPPKDVFGPEMLTAIPNVWARMLLFSEALFDENHPIHSSVVNEWRGLLGIIGLQDAYKFDVKSEEVQIGSIYSKQQAGTSLDSAEMSSLKFDTLLLKQLPHPAVIYQNLELIICEGELIGAYSPMCLVFTGARYNCPASIPWKQVTAGTGKLTDPVPYLRINGLHDVLDLLKKWVQTLKDNIAAGAKIGINLDSSYTGRLAEILNNWLKTM